MTGLVTFKIFFFKFGEDLKVQIYKNGPKRSKQTNNVPDIGIKNGSKIGKREISFQRIASVTLKMTSKVI